MRLFKISALLTAVALLVLTASAIAKVDQKGWPKIGGGDPGFFQQKTIDKNAGATHYGTDAPDKILGAHGSDNFFGLGGIDVIFGDEVPNNPGSQTDFIDGGAGGDFIYGSHGRSTLIGGEGDDKIHARYGRGTISCGPGKDKVWQARKRRKNWKIAKDCEKITYALDKNQNRK